MTSLKSSKGDQTLLAYLVKKLKAENHGDILKFVDEFTTLKEAQTINLNDVVQESNQLMSDNNKIGLAIQNAKKEGDFEYMNRFQFFYDESSKKCLEIDRLVQDTKNEYEQTARFYGEDDNFFKHKTSDEFFRNIFNFVDAVRKAEKSANLQNKYGGNQSSNQNQFMNRFM